MNKYLIGAGVALTPFAAFAQDVPADSSNLVEVIAVAVVSGLAGFGLGYLSKGLVSLESFVRSTKTQADDIAFDAIVGKLKEWMDAREAAKVKK